MCLSCSKRGIIILSLLLLLTFCSLLFAALCRMALRSEKTLGIDVAQFRLQDLLDKRFAGDLRQLQNNGATADLSALGADKVQQFKLPQASTLLLSYTEEKVRASAGLQHLLLSKSNSKDDFLLPNWAVLSQDKGIETVSCSRWRKESSTSPLSPTGTYTCLGSSLALQRNVFVPGNLLLNEDLLFEVSPDVSVRLVILGTTTIQGSLIIRSSPAFKLEVLSAGSLSLKSLLLEDSPGAQILLHSSRGKLFLSSAATAPLPCTTASPIKLRLEAGQGILLNGEVSSKTIGCHFLKPSPLWPLLSSAGLVIRRGFL